MTNSSFDSFSGELLVEYAALEYILLGDLRDLLEEPEDEITCNWLLAVLDALLETLPRELELSDEGGYLAEVLEEYPSWFGQVDRLGHEKQVLFGRLCELRARIAKQVPFAEIAEVVRRDLRDWMLSLQAHYRHERRIVQTAFNLEVGVGD